MFETTRLLCVCYTRTFFKKFPPLKIGRVISSCWATASITSHHDCCLSKNSLQSHSSVTWCSSRSTRKQRAFSALVHLLDCGPQQKVSMAPGHFPLEVAWLLRWLAGSGRSYNLTCRLTEGSSLRSTQKPRSLTGERLRQWRQLLGPAERDARDKFCVMCVLWSQCRREPELCSGEALATRRHLTPQNRICHTEASHTTEPLEEDRWMDWILMANVLCKSWSTSWPVPSPFLSYRSCLNASFSMRTIMFLRK